MTVEILMPPLSQTKDSLVLVEWLKQEGEQVVKGETLFTVETDKATLEVESPATGRLKTILAAPGDEVKVRAVIGMITEAGEEPENKALSTPLTETDLRLVPISQDLPAENSISDVTGGVHDYDDLPHERQKRIFATPRARHLVEQHGLQLEALIGTGTGPHQWIIARDVQAYLNQEESKVRATPLAVRIAEAAGIDLASIAPSKPGVSITKADVEKIILERSDQLISPETDVASLAPPGIRIQKPHEAELEISSTKQVIMLSPTRRTIIRHLEESHAAAVPVTYMSQVDATRLVKLRQSILEEIPEDGVRPTFTDFMMRITCLVLAQHPGLNAVYNAEDLEVYTSVQMGLAVDTPRGLIVPVIRAAQRKGLLELAQARSELVERTLSERVTPEELSGGTFTLTNLGTMGIDFFTPVINPPQVAILGVGRIHEVPVMRKKKIKIRQVVGLSLTCDHRFIDGAPAARFLQDLAHLIEEPDRIWL